MQGVFCIISGLEPGENYHYTYCTNWRGGIRVKMVAWSVRADIESKLAVLKLF